jgi:hypothetical protein
MRIATFATAVCLALVGTIVSAQSVTYDFDTAANFTRFKTYTWVRGTNVNDELNHPPADHAGNRCTADRQGILAGRGDREP